MALTINPGGAPRAYEALVGKFADLLAPFPDVIRCQLCMDLLASSVAAAYPTLAEAKAALDRSHGAMCKGLDDSFDRIIELRRAAATPPGNA
jgi:hypothetical protein